MGHDKTNYSQQIILTGTGDIEQAEALKAKLNRQNPCNPCIIVEFDPNLDDPASEEYQALSKLDAHSRLYIIGDGNVGLDYITNPTDGSKISYQDIATLLSNQVHPGDLIDDESRLKISLIVCYAGKSSNKSNPLNCFAGKLQGALSTKGFKVNLLARTTISLQINDSKYTPKITREEEYAELLFYFNKMNPRSTLKSEMKQINKLDKALKKLEIHHQPNSKSLFTWDEEGNQIIHPDAYEQKRKSQLSKQYGFFTQVKKTLQNLLQEETPSHVHTHPGNDKYQPH